MKVKICGITNLLDAKNCEMLGVDMIGFIFYKKSPRYINLDSSLKIISKLNNKIKKVGVFVDEDIEVINNMSNILKLNYIQLHGDEDNEYIKKIKTPTIKALNGNDINLDSKIKEFSKPEFILLDNINKDSKGGSGEKFDWKNILNLDNKEKLILSGGLNEKNIINAMKTGIKFFDFCSATEKKPGIKDSKKVKTIVKLIRDA
tara:strand:+ start:1080 stop:1688 length:609 start_codon:yes stop_codon:yes gene_type:complete